MAILKGNEHRELNVWLASDNKPGHYNQSEGLIQALSNYRKVKLERVPLCSFAQAMKMLVFKRCGQVEKSAPDFIIGTGHQTHLSLLAYRRCFGGRVITMMSPSIPTQFFDMCFIPRHDKPKKSDQVTETLGAINRVIPDNSKRVNDKGLILLGGPSKHYKWDSNSVSGNIRQLFKSAPDMKWTIAGSRRTPEAIYDAIKSQFPQVEIVLPNDVSSDWLPAEMVKAGQIWITADSISMIYEALSSGARTGVLKLAYEKPTRITNEIDRLLTERRVSTLDGVKADHSIPPMKEADRCAMLLLEKFDF